MSHNHLKAFLSLWKDKLIEIDTTLDHDHCFFPPGHWTPDTVVQQNLEQKNDSSDH